MATHLLTPRMASVLERIGRSRAPALHRLTPVQAREAYEQRAEVLDLPRDPAVRTHDLTLPGGSGAELPARLYRPPAGPDDAADQAADEAAQPWLLYLHGGGFTVGSLETHDSLCRQLARASGGVVVALDYRLAPEHRFPIAVDDAWSALRALARSTGLPVRLDPRRGAVGGDSAGGTLAAVCALLARDAGLPLALQVLITPGTAARPETPSHRLFGQGFLLDAQAIDWFFDHYIDAADRHDWRFAPLEAADLDGVAPALLVVAECDPLVDEALAYGDRLRMAGVPVELELFRGLTHDFIKMGRVLPEAVQAQQRIGQALRLAWAAAAGGITGSKAEA